MDVDAHIKSITRNEHGLLIKADANLWKDGLRIYQVTDIGVLIKEA